VTDLDEVTDLGDVADPVDLANPVDLADRDDTNDVGLIGLESPLPARSDLGARWRPGSSGSDEVEDISEDDDLDAVGFDPSDHDRYRADEPDHGGLPAAWRVSHHPAGTPESVEAPLDQNADLGVSAADDDLESSADDAADDEDLRGGGQGYPRSPDRGDGGYGSGGWPERPASRSPDFGDDRSLPERGLRRGSEFDLEGAAASAGYSMPGDQVEMEEVAERIPARRGMGGIFSKSAGERFSAVAGAIREQPGSMKTTTHRSVADQILASQEQLRSGSKVVRFTPALVKKDHHRIGHRVDRGRVRAHHPHRDRIPGRPCPGGSRCRLTCRPPSRRRHRGATPSTTVPENETTTGGIEVVDSRPVFELDSAGFVDRWNDTGSQSPRVWSSAMPRPWERSASGSHASWGWKAWWVTGVSSIPTRWSSTPWAILRTINSGSRRSGWRSTSPSRKRPGPSSARSCSTWGWMWAIRWSRAWAVPPPATA
jgi:hypothetical protein